jgi:hypothetical protein
MRWLHTIALGGFVDRPPAVETRIAQAAPELDHDATKGLRFPMVSGLLDCDPGRWRWHWHSPTLNYPPGQRDL